MSKFIRIFRSIIHDLVILLVPKVLRKNMLSCEQVTQLLEQDQLSGSKRLKLKMHLLICQCCTDYKKQMSIITQESKKLTQQALTPEQKKRIKNSKFSVIEKYKNSK